MKADAGDTTGARQPAVLFLIVDCLRADRAFAQAELAPTGFLGSLASRGRVFTSAITVTPTTTPAVASMLTGLYPYEHGLRGLSGFSLPDGIPTVASVLARGRLLDRGTRHRSAAFPAEAVPRLR